MRPAAPPPTALSSLLLLSMLVVGAACQTQHRDASGEQPHPATFAGCAPLLATPSTGSAAHTPSPNPQPPGRPLPQVSLPCYVDGVQIDVAALRGPAVINIWASWCAPCRRELPVFQQFAERNREVGVLGVASADRATATTGLAADLGLTFPHLRDDRGRLMRELGRTALPVTVFVGGSGRIRSIYSGEALDANTLDSLVERYLGVTPA